MSETFYRWSKSLALFAPLVLSSCKVGPDFHPPEAHVPSAWTGMTELTTPQAAVATSNRADIAQWWRTFNDPKLTDLVEQAVQTKCRVVTIVTKIVHHARATPGEWPTLKQQKIEEAFHTENSSSGNSLRTFSCRLATEVFCARWNA
jgi:hypothetical protein